MHTGTVVYFEITHYLNIGVMKCHTDLYISDGTPDASVSVLAVRLIPECYEQKSKRRCLGIENILLKLENIFE